MQAISLKVSDKLPDAVRCEEWAVRHNRAVICGHTTDGSHMLDPQLAIPKIFAELHRYARWHEWRYESKIAEDGEIGRRGWLPMLKGLRYLLNGETKDLDCGTVDGAILELAKAAGFTEEDV